MKNRAKHRGLEIDMSFKDTGCRIKINLASLDDNIKEKMEMSIPDQ